MRWLFSLGALMLALYFVLQLGKTQMQALPGAGAGVAGAASAANASQHVQQDIQKALQQGMDQRASEPSQ